MFTPFGGYPVWWSIVFAPFGAVQHTEKVANAFHHNMADTKRVLIQQDLRYAKVQEDEHEADAAIDAKKSPNSTTFFLELSFLNTRK